MKTKILKTTLCWSFIMATVFLFVLSSCQKNETDQVTPEDVIADSLVKTSRLKALAASTNSFFCDFDGTSFCNLTLTNGLTPANQYNHSWGYVEDGWFKGIINKDYSNVGLPEENDANYRGRAEVMHGNFIPQPLDGKEVEFSIKWFAPFNCTLSNMPNDVGCIGQLIVSGTWNPVFLLTEGDNLVLNVYTSATTSVAVRIRTGNGRGGMHSISIKGVLSRSGGIGYWDVTYDGGAWYRAYNGRTLPTTNGGPCAFKAGTYSMGPWAWHSEVWIHNVYCKYNEYRPLYKNVCLKGTNLRYLNSKNGISAMTISTSRISSASFYIEPNINSGVSLKASNGKYVTVHSDNTLWADGTSPTRFQWIPIGGSENKFILKYSDTFLGGTNPIKAGYIQSQAMIFTWEY